MNMDLKKLDPMARKLRGHVDAFYKALEEQNSYNAGTHITEVMKYAEYLSNDVHSAITKSDNSVIPQGINDIYVGGVPVQKFNSTQTVHEATTRVLPGTVRTTRRGPIMQQRNNRTL